MLGDHDRAHLRDTNLPVVNPIRRLLGRPLPPRVAIVQRELDRFAGARYLEIGVKTGVLFLHVRARSKVGVDPVPAVAPWKRLLHPNTLLRGRLVTATSDAYFARLPPAVRFDVVFVDGDHAYHQSLRDVENALARLAPDGVVLAHDCNPPSAGAASPEARDAAGGAWCGDTWKAIAHLRASRADLSVETLDLDFGIGVIRQQADGERPALELDPGSIERMAYADLDASRAELLGLRAPEGLSA